jgi:phage replication-related protein YjqB (UPF0714/DUF867 family)
MPLPHAVIWRALTLAVLAVLLPAAGSAVDACATPSGLDLEACPDGDAEALATVAQPTPLDEPALTPPDIDPGITEEASAEVWDAAVPETDDVATPVGAAREPAVCPPPSGNDLYGCYAELAKQHTRGDDYEVRSREVGAAALVMSPHGGGIEPGSTELADAIAGDAHEFYDFAGTMPTRNFDLHITSTNFDEPLALELVSAAETALAVHGASGDQEIVYVGGRDAELARLLEDELRNAGFSVQDPPPALAGTSESNIVNRTRSGGGVQIELTRGLRASMFDGGLDRASRQQPTEAFHAFVDAARHALEARTAGDAGGEVGGFVDVQPDHPHSGGITFVADADVTRGFPDGSFRPADAVTRGQMAAFLTRALDLPAAGADSAFADVAADHTHADAVARVAAAGIATGFPDGTYRPSVRVSRAQMATFLARALDLEDAGGHDYDDVPSDHPHARGIAAVAGGGITQGYGNGTFGPADAVTRAQMATFLHRALAP